MYTTSTSRRRGKVKRRPSQVKPPEVFSDTRSTDASPPPYRAPYVPPPIERTWLQRHPGVTVFISSASAVSALVLLIALIPKSPQSHYYAEEKQPTLSALDTSSSRQGQRAAPTDASFLATHYRRESPAPSERYPTQASHSGGYARTTTPVAMASGPDAHFGDGTVSRKNGHCQIQATGTGHFAEALVACVTGGR